MAEQTCGHCGGAILLEDQVEPGAQFACPHCGGDVEMPPEPEESAFIEEPAMPDAAAEPPTEPTAPVSQIVVRKRYSGVVLVTLLIAAYVYFGFFGLVWRVFNSRRIDDPLGAAAVLLALSMALLWCCCQGCLSARWRRDLFLPALFGGAGVLAQWGALRVLADTQIVVERIHILPGALGAYLPVLATGVLVIGLVLLSVWDCPGLQPQAEREAASARERQALALRPRSDTVELNRSCRRCGYNLRGLALWGRCPECGTAVTESLKGDGLAAADPNWLARVRTGLDLMRLGMLLAAGALAAVFVAASANQPEAWETWLALVYLAGQLIYLGGVWLLTTRDPSGGGERAYGLGRRVVRVAAAVLAADTCLATLTAVGAVNVDRVAVNILRALFVAAVGFTMFTTHLYVLSKLAARIPHDRLADSAGRLLYGFGYGTGIFVFFVLAAPGVALLIAIGLFVLAVNYVVLLARMRGAMARILASPQASTKGEASSAAVTR